MGCLDTAAIQGIPTALHRAEKELPFVVYQEGVDFQLLHADVEAGLWVIRTRFQPGVTIQRHKHTGEVFAFTLTGFVEVRRIPGSQYRRIVSVRASRLDSYVACACDEYGDDRCLVRHPRS